MWRCRPTGRPTVLAMRPTGRCPPGREAKTRGPLGGCTGGCNGRWSGGGRGGHQQSIFVDVWPPLYIFFTKGPLGCDVVSEVGRPAARLPYVGRGRSTRAATSDRHGRAPEGSNRSTPTNEGRSTKMWSMALTASRTPWSRPARENPSYWMALKPLACTDNVWPFLHMFGHFCNFGMSQVWPF